MRVYVSVAEGRHALYSRYCTESFAFSDSTEASEYWHDLLLGPRGGTLRGSVVFPCNDDAVGFVARHRGELADRYILDDSRPDVQLAMLDKLETLTLAQSVNVETPRFWRIERPDQIETLGPDVPYPLIVKPLHSHLFQAKFQGRRYLTVHTHADARAALERVWQAGLQAMLCEWIPGPDDRLASYYTYIDRDGRPLFHFTKQVIRRFPKNEGLASYHITGWDGEVAELGARFLTGINFRGLGNVEFKRDVRDNRLKLVECNSRFTAPQELLVRCGLDIASLIYDHLIGLPVLPPVSYKDGIRQWYPIRDFLAYRQLRTMNELSFGDWLKSVWHRQTFPFFQPADPLPSIMPAMLAIRRRLYSIP